MVIGYYNLKFSKNKLRDGVILSQISVCIHFYMLYHSHDRRTLKFGETIVTLNTVSFVVRSSREDFAVNL